MITEIAQIDVKPGSEKDFEAAVTKAKAAFGAPRAFMASSCTSRSRSRSATV